jgi:hypothetical protein
MEFKKIQEKIREQKDFYQMFVISKNKTIL